MWFQAATNNMIKMPFVLCAILLVVVPFGSSLATNYTREAVQVTPTIPAPQIVATKNPTTPPPLQQADLLKSQGEMGIEQEAEWIQKPKAGEIEQAIHGLDLIHMDFSMTGEILIILSLLLFVTTLKPTLRLPVIKHIPESVMLMLYGLGIAIGIKLTLTVGDIKLDQKLFFVFLLPWIVSDAGLSMQKQEFFSMLPRILVFAVGGTVMGSLLLAYTYYQFSDFLKYEMPFMHLLVFATIISAVDPVSVLSTFSEIDVKRQLFTLIFGESLLNDAVTIVLYHTSLDVIKNEDVSHALTWFECVKEVALQFLIVSLCGIAIGYVAAILGVCLIKRCAGFQILLPIYELLIPFWIYLVVESLHYSGILACVTCSMVMSHYMHENVCVEMEFVVFTVSKTFSSTSEMIIFIYLGLSGVSSYHDVDINFILITLIACPVIRAINVFILSAICNYFAAEEDKMNFKEQLIVIHAGIRGAVCFGLVQSIDSRVIPAKEMMVTCTLVMIAFTSVVQGCSIKLFLKVLKISGDTGVAPTANKVMEWYQEFDKNHIRPHLSSKSTYLPTDETFRHLALPKAVSTALRIGERSQPDLYNHSREGRLTADNAVSVPRATNSPFVDFNLEENLIIPPAPLSTGRRTPVQRGSIYSRHFVNIMPPSPIEAVDPENNYSTCPARITKKRPTFNPNDTFYNQTISGMIERKPRHNSIGGEPIEMKDISFPPKKNSRTVVTGTKTFVVAPEELNLIKEESTSPKKSDEDIYGKHSDSD